MIKRYQRAIFLSVFFALLLTALVGGALFLAHHKTVERHLEFARELLVKDVTQRFETLFEGYLYWDAMVHAAEKGHEDFLEEQFDDMEESYGLREWLLEKDGRLLYRFGSSLLDTSLIHSLAPEELEIHPGEGKEILFVQKLPLLFEDGTPSKFYALMGITDLEILHTINTFLGTHLMITQTQEGIPLSGEYHLQEESVCGTFSKMPPPSTLWASPSFSWRLFYTASACFCCGATPWRPNSSPCPWYWKNGIPTRRITPARWRITPGLSQEPWG